MPTFNIEYTLTGNVVFDAPAIKKLITTSSNDIINDKAAPDIIPGRSSGIVICSKACHCVAPRSRAAYSKFVVMLSSRAVTIIITNGTQNDKWDNIKVFIPNLTLRTEKICINAIPIIISGVRTGK